MKSTYARETNTRTADYKYNPLCKIIVRLYIGDANEPISAFTQLQICGWLATGIVG